MERDIIERLQNVVDGDPEQVFSPNAWAPELNPLLQDAIVEILGLRLLVPKPRKLGAVATPVPIEAIRSIPLRLDQEAYILARLAPGEVEKIAEAMLKIMDDRVEQALAEVM